MEETLLIGIILVMLSIQTGLFIAGICWLKLEKEFHPSSETQPEKLHYGFPTKKCD